MKLFLFCALALYVLPGCTHLRNEKTILLQKKTIDSLNRQIAIYQLQEQVLRKQIIHWQHCYQVDIRN